VYFHGHHYGWLACRLSSLCIPLYYGSTPKGGNTPKFWPNEGRVNNRRHRVYSFTFTYAFMQWISTPDVQVQTFVTWQQALKPIGTWSTYNRRVMGCRQAKHAASINQSINLYLNQAKSPYTNTNTHQHTHTHAQNTTASRGFLATARLSCFTCLFWTSCLLPSTSRVVVSVSNVSVSRL